MTNNVKFSYGTKASYVALETKDTNTLYFLTDTLQLYKGTDEYTKSARIVSSLPTTNQVQGVVYVRVSDFTLHIYNGTEYIQLTKEIVTAIPEAATDNTVPTTKAVADYVTNKIADVTGGVGVFVTDVTYTPGTGTLSVAKGAEPVNTVLNGVVNNPTYDANTRTITLPVFGGSNLVITLGKDAFVESGHYDTDKETIELVLTSGDKVSIPVGSLIDIYSGIATATANVTVSADNKISVDVKVSATANNAIIIEEDGLYVSLPDAYTKKETDDKIKIVSDKLDSHASDTDVHVTAAKKAEWDAKATASDVETAKSQAISAAAIDATAKANKALEDAKTYSDGLNSTMSDRVAATEDALTWKQII